MARTRVAKLAFNRGLVSRLGMARADIKRLAMAAEVQKNWVCRVLGSMMLRPGWGHLGSSFADARAFYIPFVFSVTDKALIELTEDTLRVWIDDEQVEREAVSTVVANGTFDVNLASWTDADEAGAVSDWAAGGYMQLNGTGNSYAIRRQGPIAVSAADQNVEHALHIIIHRGPVVLRVGSSSGDDDYITETELGQGAHSLAFTPTGATVWIEFKSRLERAVFVNSCVVEGAGFMTVEAPWVEEDLGKVRYDQSGDIVFVACDGYQQRKIERRAAHSWSVVRYQADDGPFRTPNATTMTLTPTSTHSNIAITSSAPFFKRTHAPSTNNDGALFRLTSNGQFVEATIGGENQFTSAIRVTGVGNARVFLVRIDEDAAGAATFTLQRSLESQDGPWTDVQQWTADTTETYNDTLDNQIAWYRLGVKTGDYVNGVHSVSLEYTVGSIDGIARVTGFISSTQVEAEVLTNLGGTSATDDWAEGSWSDLHGFPTAVAFHEGRLTWAGRDAAQLSVSDAFDSFDPDFEGDAGPINRTIGSGPVDNINWVLSLQRLLLGGQGAEFSVRSSSLDEPLTPTNFNLKSASTQGSASVAAVKVDQSGIFVQRGGSRVYELSFGQTGVDYEASHLSALAPEIGQPEIVKLVVQRQPDTRVHCIRSDGTVAMLVFDKVEQVVAWLEVETDGAVEDAVILPGDPGDPEDLVYYSVKRAINGVEKRFLEKWAFEVECRGDEDLCMLADCYVAYSGVATTTVRAQHLANQQVVIWADGADVGTNDDGTLIYTLDNAGEARLPEAVSNYVVGLPYEAPYQSARLVELMETMGGSLTDLQIVKSMALILADVHAKGLKYGQSLVESEMRDLPEFDSSGPVDPDAVRESYETEDLAVNGEWTNDARLCLLAKAPRPVTVLAAISEVEHHG